MAMNMGGMAKTGKQLRDIEVKLTLEDLQNMMKGEQPFNNMDDLGIGGNMDGTLDDATNQIDDLLGQDVDSEDANVMDDGLGGIDLDGGMDSGLSDINLGDEMDDLGVSRDESEDLMHESERNFDEGFKEQEIQQELGLDTPEQTKEDKEMLFKDHLLDHEEHEEDEEIEDERLEDEEEEDEEE